MKSFGITVLSLVAITLAVTLAACSNSIKLSLYVQGNYIRRKNAIVKALLAADFTITDRRFVGYETDTKYYHVNIDVAKSYAQEE